MKAYTDYPICELGDAPGKVAPIRECEVVTYDGDKYCYVNIQGLSLSIKRGYLYTTPARLEDGAEPIDVSLIHNFTANWRT